MAQMLLNRCRCGTDMEAFENNPRFSFCPNCDRTQEAEQQIGGARKPTTADRYYHLAWERLKRDLYTPMTRWPDGGRIG